MLTLQPIKKRVRGKDPHVAKAFGQNRGGQRVLMQVPAEDRDARYIFQLSDLRGGVRFGGGLLRLDDFYLMRRLCLRERVVQRQVLEEWCGRDKLETGVGQESEQPVQRGSQRCNLSG